MELGDAVHTTTLTLKEGSKGQISDEMIGLGLSALIENSERQRYGKLRE